MKTILRSAAVFALVMPFLARAQMNAQNEFSKDFLEREQAQMLAYLRDAEDDFSRARSSAGNRFYSTAIAYSFSGKVKLTKAERFMEDHPARIALLSNSIWYDEEEEQKLLKDAFAKVKDFHYKLKQIEGGMDQDFAMVLGDGYRKLVQEFKEAAAEAKRKAKLSGDESALDKLDLEYGDRSVIEKKVEEIEEESGGSRTGPERPINGGGFRPSRMGPSVNPASRLSPEAAQFRQLIEQMLADPNIPESVKARLRKTLSTLDSVASDPAKVREVISQFLRENGDLIQENTTPEQRAMFAQAARSMGLDPAALRALEMQKVAGPDGQMWDQETLEGGVKVLTGPDGQRIVIGPDLQGVQKVYIGGEGKNLVEEVKLKFAVGEDGSTQIEDKTVRGWDLRIREAVERRQMASDGSSLQTQFILDEPQNRGNLKITQWTLTAPSGATTARGDSDEFSVSFQESGVYTVSVVGETEWGSRFEVSQPTNINLE